MISRLVVHLGMLYCLHRPIRHVLSGMVRRVVDVRYGTPWTWCIREGNAMVHLADRS